MHKTIPIGAGLGGGSSDAAYTIKMLNDLFDLNLTSIQMQSYASRLGSDCAFFIENKPVFASGKGDAFAPIALDLSSYFIALVKPPVHVSTAEAYGGIRPEFPENSLKELISQPVYDLGRTAYRTILKSIFLKHIPKLKESKMNYMIWGPFMQV